MIFELFITDVSKCYDLAHADWKTLSCIPRGGQTLYTRSNEKGMHWRRAPVKNFKNIASEKSFSWPWIGEPFLLMDGGVCCIFNFVDGWKSPSLSYKAFIFPTLQIFGFLPFNVNRQTEKSTLYLLREHFEKLRRGFLDVRMNFIRGFPSLFDFNWLMPVDREFYYMSPTDSILGYSVRRSNNLTLLPAFYLKDARNDDQRRLQTKSSWWKLI